MTKRSYALLCTVLSLVFCFLSIGYAAVSDPFLIRGSADIEVPSGLFITKIEELSSSGLRTHDISFEPYSTTVKCSLRKSSNSTAGSATYRITVRNNTKRAYTYRKLYYQTNLSEYDNDKISTTSGRNSLGVEVNYPKTNGSNTIIEPGGEFSFEVTYSLGASSSSFPSRNTYYTLINYQFGINVDSEAEAVEAVQDKFLNILNTTDTYLDLVDVLDNKYDGSNAWTSNYVGNVGDATSDDALTVNTLFAGQLELMINGQTKPATVLIKHEDLDNNRNTGDDYIAYANSGSPCYGYGCEMTLYLTTHSLKRADSSDGNAPVYVSVFTCNRDENGDIVGGWYRIGEVYEGYANIVGYKGEANGEGSFVTDNWLSYARTYKVTDNYSYYAPAGTTIKALVQETDQALVAEFQRLLTEAKSIFEDTRYAGTGIEEVELAYYDAINYFTVDANGNPYANGGSTRAQLIPVVRRLDEAIKVVKDKISQVTDLL